MKNKQKMIDALKRFRVAAIGGTVKSISSFFNAEGLHKDYTAGALFDILKEENFIVTNDTTIYWRPELILSDEIASDLIDRANIRMHKIRSEKRMESMKASSEESYKSIDLMVQEINECESKIAELTAKITELKTNVNSRLSDFLKKEGISIEDLVKLCE